MLPVVMLPEGDCAFCTSSELPGVTAMLMVAVLLVSTPSPTPPPAAMSDVCVMVEPPPTDITPGIENVRFAPTASEPTLQVSVLPLIEQPLGSDEPGTNPGGMLYVSVDAGEVFGPLLVTTSCSVCVLPAATWAGAVAVTPRSAPTLTVMVLVSPVASGVRAETCNVPDTVVRSSTFTLIVCDAASVIPLHVSVPGPACPAVMPLQLKPAGSVPVPW
ncbi:MAG: hypothetical protein QM803_15465 [Rhodocyclaceae bacterium]